MDWTPDGKLVYTSGLGGSDDLWTMDADGSHPVQLTASAGQNIGPSISPDGRRLLFASNRQDGKLSIWSMGLDGSDTRRLTTVPGDIQPRVSPDGKWLVYEALGAGRPTIMKVPLSGGEPKPVTDTAIFPAFSSDGKLLAFFQVRLNTPGQARPEIAVMPFNGGAATKTFALPNEAEGFAGLAWSSDDRELLYVQRREGAENIFAQPMSGGAVRQVTHFDSGRIFSFALSRRVHQLAVARGGISSDLVLIDLKK